MRLDMTARLRALSRSALAASGSADAAGDASFMMRCALLGLTGEESLERFRFARKRSDSLSLTAVGRRALARAYRRDGQRLRGRAAYAAGRGCGLSRGTRAERTMHPCMTAALQHGAPCRDLSGACKCL